MKKLLLGLAALFTFSLVAPTIARAEGAQPAEGEKAEKGEKKMKKGKKKAAGEEKKAEGGESK
jgi:hypothetical protein